MAITSIVEDKKSREGERYARDGVSLVKTYRVYYDDPDASIVNEFQRHANGVRQDEPHPEYPLAGAWGFHRGTAIPPTGCYIHVEYRVTAIQFPSKEVYAPGWEPEWSDVDESDRLLESYDEPSRPIGKPEFEYLAAPEGTTPSDATHYVQVTGEQRRFLRATGATIPIDIMAEIPACVMTLKRRVTGFRYSTVLQLLAYKNRTNHRSFFAFPSGHVQFRNFNIRPVSGELATPRSIVRVGQQWEITLRFLLAARDLRHYRAQVLYSLQSGAQLPVRLLETGEIVYVEFQRRPSAELYSIFALF